jgi:hypothetical protein
VEKKILNKTGGCRLTRGTKLLVAIGVAKRKATAWGFMLIGLETDEKLPYDFAFHNKGKLRSSGSGD